jgi:hypothetical protein
VSRGLNCPKNGEFWNKILKELMMHILEANVSNLINYVRIYFLHNLIIALIYSFSCKIYLKGA